MTDYYLALSIVVRNGIALNITGAKATSISSASG